MDDYQELNSVPHGMDRSHSAAPPLPQPFQRHKKQPQYSGSAYVPHSHAQSAQNVGHQPMGNMPPAGYDWNGYPTQVQTQSQVMVHDASMHGASSRGVSTTQPLRIKVTERLQQIDRETFENEERVCQQKAEEIQNDISMILRGTHPAFVDGVARLASERERTLRSAAENHQYLVAMYERT
ncbi:hypothetical protein GGF41_002619, partial [Coemansia sp. RSA 2531]